MKIYIVGTGGVGGYFGGKLAYAGNDVTFLARNEIFEEIKKDGLIVKSTDGDFSINPAKVIKDISEITNPDLILFTVKTYDTEAVAKELAGYVNENTVIITFQNGINNAAIISKYIKNAKVYSGIAYVISTKTAPNVISQTGGLKRLVFGDKENPNNEKLKEIELMMKEANVDAVLSSNIESDLWKKYIFINAFSGMTALNRMNIGEVLRDEKLAAMYEECVKESISVANKLGVVLPETIFEDTMKLTRDTNPQSKSSLLVDIENSRRNEIETLNGTLVNIAKELGIQISVNEKIYNEITQITS